MNNGNTPRLYFDGDALPNSSTLADHDLEDGDCLEAK